MTPKDVMKFVKEQGALVKGFLRATKQAMADCAKDPKGAVEVLAKAVAEVIPALKGKLNGTSVRVPTPNVSLVDLVCEVEKDTTKEEVNAELRRAAGAELKGILEGATQ